MAIRVDTFVHQNLGAADYLFFVLRQGLFDTPIQKALGNALPLLGELMGSKGRVIEPYPNFELAVAIEMVKKKWPRQIRRRIYTETDPFIIVTTHGYGDFDPSKDRWRIVWLTSARSPANSIPTLFAAIVPAVVRGEDVFAYLDSVRDARTGLSLYGEISAPEDDDRRPAIRRAGRPGILDDEWGVKQHVSILVHLDADEKGWSKIPRGEKTSFAKAICSYLHPRGFDFSPESVRDALAKEGFWKSIDKSLAERARSKKTR